MNSMKPGVVSYSVMNFAAIALGMVGLVIAYWPNLLPSDKSMELATLAGGLIGKAMQRSGDVGKDSVRDVVVHTLTELTTPPQVPSVQEDVGPNDR